MDDRSSTVSGTQEPDATTAATSTTEKAGRLSRRDRRRAAVVTAVPDETSVAGDVSEDDDATPDQPTTATAPPGAVAVQRRKSVIMVVVGAIVVAFLGWLVGTQIVESPADVAARSEAPPPSPILEPVIEQKLSTKVRARGTGGFGSPRPVTLPASNLGGGTVITSLPAPNDVIQEGGVLATISGRPVLALGGEAPMYRDMGPGMSGQDVAQLEAALQRIGINPGTVDGLYDGGTEAAVQALYTNAGFQPVVASLLQLDAVRAAQCQTNPGSCPGPGVQVPANELFFVAGAPVQVGEVTGVVGSEASGPLMTVSDSTPKVAGSIRVEESKLVKPGMDVDIDEPDLGITADGKVTAVAERPGTNGLDQFHVYFETSVEDAPDRLNGVSVRVVIPIKTTDKAELTVPVSAVVLDTNGTSRVQVLTKNGLQNVEVEPGLSADGYVVVKPVKKNALEPGDKVVVGYQQR
jgi:peptidoglycan hydrolase-like protein with peptidoglycan-binding domain